MSAPPRHSKGISDEHRPSPLRIVIGLLLVGHGSQKLFGWFGGPGIAGTVGLVRVGGVPAGQGHGRTSPACPRWSAARLLALGLLTPLETAIIVGTLLVAVVAVHLPYGLWAGNGGYELPLSTSSWRPRSR